MFNVAHMSKMSILHGDPGLNSLNSLETNTVYIPLKSVIGMEQLVWTLAQRRNHTGVAPKTSWYDQKPITRSLDLTNGVGSYVSRDNN